MVYTTGINEVCLHVAENEIAKRIITLDDIERITSMKDTHKWGTEASRKKRNSIVAEFKRMVMKDITILYQFEIKK